MSDHEWDQMSVMERCEVLRAGLASTERRVDRDDEAQIAINAEIRRAIHDLARRVDRLTESIQHYGNEDTKRNNREDELERRVADCEIDGHKMRELADKIARRELVEASMPPAQFTQATIGQAEFARLRRIEEAAKSVDKAYLPGRRWAILYEPLDRLRAALDSEPKR